MRKISIYLFIFHFLLLFFRPCKILPHCRFLADYRYFPLLTIIYISPLLTITFIFPPVTDDYDFSCDGYPHSLVLSLIYCVMLPFVQLESPKGFHRMWSALNFLFCMHEQVAVCWI